MYRENATGQVLKPTHVFIRSQYTCRTWSQHDRKCGRHLSFIQHYHDQKRRRDRANERATANDIPSVFHCERVWCFGTLVLNPIRCDTPPAYTHLSMQCMCISVYIYCIFCFSSARKFQGRYDAITPGIFDAFSVDAVSHMAGLGK